MHDKINMAPEKISQEREQEDQEKPPGIGPSLKAARQNKGLTLDQIAAETKLRRHLLEAIENENWGILPAPVFVKGFIRSYARALGLNENDIVVQYERIGELEESLPRPLIKPVRSYSMPIIILILVLIAVAAIILLWRGSKTQYSTPDQAIGNMMEERSDLFGETISSESAILAKMSSLQGLGPVEETDPESLAEKDQPEIIKRALTAPESTPEGPAGQPDPGRDPLILKARILERTWVKIYIDDKGPKEYILQPGSTPRWEAVNGFDILIGNAAGIEFEFAEKSYRNLGRPGQVVRLQFPEEFRANIPEE